MGLSIVKWNVQAPEQVSRKGARGLPIDPPRLDVSKYARGLPIDPPRLDVSEYARGLPIDPPRLDQIRQPRRCSWIL